MSKKTLAESMLNDIPEDLRSLFGQQFGNFSQLEEPLSVDDATIAMGKMCVEIQNKMLVPLSGLPLVDVMMYLGSLTPPIVAGLFSGVEALNGSGPFDVIAPKNGGIYPGYFDAWSVRAPNVESITVTVDAGTESEDSFELDQNDDVWSRNWPIAIGDHTANFSDGSQSMDIAFSVVGYNILAPIVTPIDEETKEVEFRYELPEGAGADSGEITVSDGINTWNVVLAVTGTIAAGIAILPVGAVAATVAGVIAFATGAQLVINEYVTNVD